MTDGSSPHAWGTRAPPPAPGGGGRFIPTRMGNTRRLPVTLPRAAVHPHTHGEHNLGPLAPGVADGSSPHAWGTLFILLPLERNYFLCLCNKALHCKRPPTLRCWRCISVKKIWSSFLHYLAPSARKEINFMPSISRGIRRFVPAVTKS